MPSPTPNDGKAKPQLNEWGYVEIPKGNPVYETLDTIQEYSDGVFQTIGAFFDAINLVLDFMSSLLVDISNPLLLLLKEIIAIIDALAQDLKNLGLYIAHEGKLYTGGDAYNNLLGGYPAYEERILKKVLNDKDPTRPDFTTKSKVFGLHFFAGADDINKFSKVHKAIKKLIAIFDQKNDFEGVADPKSLEHTYFQTILGGNFELPTTEVTKTTIPDGVRLNLTFTTPPPKTALGGIITVPKDVLVCVSNKPSGEFIGYHTPRVRMAFEKDKYDTPYIIPASKSDAISVPAHLVSIVTNQTTSPITTDQKVVDGELTEVSGVTPNNRYLSVISSEDILSPLSEDRLSRAFVQSVYAEGENSFFLTSPSKQVTIDLPKHLLFNDEVSEVYITCYGVGDEPADLRTKSTGVEGLTEVVSSGMYNPKLGSVVGLSKPTKTIKVSNISDLASQYISAMREFYAWAILSGAGGGETALKTLFGTSIPTYFRGGTYAQLQSVLKEVVKHRLQREALAGAIKSFIDLRLRTLSVPPTRVLREVKEDMDLINDYPFSLYEIISKQEEGGDADGYFTLNPVSGKLVEGVFFGFDYQQSVNSVYDWNYYSSLLGLEASSDTYYYDDLGSARYQGHVAYKKSHTQVLHKVVGKISEVTPILTAGNRLLSLSFSTPTKAEGDWIALKPFRDTDFSVFVDYLDTIKIYMETFAKALEGIVKTIQDYIRLVQTRIAELQAIIAKIKAIIDLILGLRFPAGLYTTYHIADGTSGLASSILRAEQKPRIGSDGLGTGLLVVGGGLPTIFIELILAIAGIEED